MLDIGDRTAHADLDIFFNRAGPLPLLFTRLGTMSEATKHLTHCNQLDCSRNIIITADVANTTTVIAAFDMTVSTVSTITDTNITDSTDNNY